MDIAKISDEIAEAKERGWSQEIAGLTQGIKERIEGFTSANPSIWERSDLRELNFEDLAPRIRRLQFVARRVASLPISDLPASIIGELQSALDQIKASLDDIRTFDLLKIAESRSDPREHRSRILNNAHDRFNQAERSLAIAMGMLGAMARPTDYDAPAKNELLKLAAAAVQARQDAEAIARLAVDSRESVKSLEAARHGEFFGSEARDHKRWSYGWLAATAVVAVLTGLAAWANYENSRTDLGTYVSGGSMAQLIVAKVVLFSIGISATLWCAKVYLAHRHNYVVNRHRQNSLNSFQTFADAASDDATKNTVLVQAMQAIYAPQPTSYSALGAESPTGLQVVDLVRAASQAKGS